MDWAGPLVLAGVPGAARSELGWALGPSPVALSFLISLALSVSLSVSVQQEPPAAAPAARTSHPAAPAAYPPAPAAPAPAPRLLTTGRRGAATRDRRSAGGGLISPRGTRGRRGPRARCARTRATSGGRRVASRGAAPTRAGRWATSHNAHHFGRPRHRYRSSAGGEDQALRAPRCLECSSSLTERLEGLGSVDSQMSYLFESQ